MIKNKKKILISLLLLTFFLCGCEKKEEVVLSFDDSTVDFEDSTAQANTQEEVTQMQQETVPMQTDVLEGEAQAQSKEKLLLEDTAYAYVHICGAVVSPGVYKVRAGSRIYEVIDLAGGFLPEACTEYRNQAQPIEDGMQIVIPTRQEVLAGEVFSENSEIGQKGSQGQFAEETALVNINTASKEVLCTLPGIGEARAESIIQYRKEYGVFHTEEDLMLVEGIKEKAYLKLKDYITVK